MNALQKFWTQPSAAHRNHQLLFGVLTIAFGCTAIFYAAAPEAAASNFARWDTMFGGVATGYPEPQCRIWTSLAAANVATLAWMSFLLVRDLRANRAIVGPLLVMKCASAGLFLSWWLAVPSARSLLVSAVADFVTAGLIWMVVRRALAALPVSAK
jgi:hypothetical protein